MGAASPTSEATNSSAKTELSPGALVELPDQFVIPITFEPKLIISDAIAAANGNAAAVQAAANSSHASFAGRVVNPERTATDVENLSSRLTTEGEIVSGGDVEVAETPSLGCRVSTNGDVRFVVLPEVTAGKRIWAENRPDEDDPATFDRRYMIGDTSAHVIEPTIGSLRSYMPTTHDSITLERKFDSAHLTSSRLCCRVEADGALLFFVGER